MTGISENFYRFHCDVIAKWCRNSKKQHRNSESTKKVVANQLQESKSGTALGFHFVTPRKVVDKNVVLNFWPRLYLKSGFAKWFVCERSQVANQTLRTGQNRIANFRMQISNKGSHAISFHFFFI